MRDKRLRYVVSASPADSERTCFLESHRTRFTCEELVSHREFSYSHLSRLPVNCYSFVRIIAAPRHAGFVLIHDGLESRGRSAPSDLPEQFDLGREGKKGPRHLPRSSGRHSRLLLSTRPCVSRAAAFVVVVIVSSRVMGRFQAARQPTRRRSGVGSGVKRQPRKRRHVGARSPSIERRAEENREFDRALTWSSNGNGGSEIASALSLIIFLKIELGETKRRARGRVASDLRVSRGTRRLLPRCGKVLASRNQRQHRRRRRTGAPLLDC